MTVLDTLITDRTGDDVEYARELLRRGLDRMSTAEKETVKSGLKGSYGPTDMNRVREAIEYIDSLAIAAKRDSAYVPVMIPHKVPAAFDGTGLVTEWNQWTDKVWIDYDFPSPALWAAHLGNINALWVIARRFVAVVLPRYDPDERGYLKTGTDVEAGKLFQVLDSVGLLELRVSFEGPPDITAAGTAWTVTQTETGWIAKLDYSNCPYPDIGDALNALVISCNADQTVDGAFTLSATLRYDYEVTSGTCLVSWSPFVLWGEATEQYTTWGVAKPRTWGQAARGENP